MFDFLGGLFNNDKNNDGNGNNNRIAGDGPRNGREIRDNRGARAASNFGGYNCDFRLKNIPRRFNGLRTFNIINSEGEYVTINTNCDPNFRGRTWDHIISSYQSRTPIAGIVSKKVTSRNDSSKIFGYMVEIHADNGSHIVTAFMPARFSGLRIKSGDIVVFVIKEFDPLLSRRKYSLIIQLVEHIPVRLQ